MVRAIKDYAYLALAIFAGWYALTTFFPDKPDLPDLAPSLVLDDLEGLPNDLADLRGRPVVINFWATWCPPCVQEIPGFASYAQAHPEVAVLGIAIDSGTAAEVRAAVEQLEIPYPVLLGTRQTERTWDIETLPTTVFIGAEGQVLGSFVGGMSEQTLSAELERALAQRAER